MLRVYRDARVWIITNEVITIKSRRIVFVFFLLKCKTYRCASLTKNIMKALFKDLAFIFEQIYLKLAIIIFIYVYLLTLLISDL